jgi:hypothetical protein
MPKHNFVDLTDHTFAHWTVQHRSDPPRAREAHWLCQCICGETKVISGVRLRKGTWPRCRYQPPANLAFLDLTGQIFMHWNVQARVYEPGSRGVHWLCHCACGATKIILGARLRRGDIPRCECQPQYNFMDLTGQPFGRWRVLERAHNDLNGITQWWCECSCGTRNIIHAANLVHGNSLSCGCYKKARTSQTKTTHGRSRSPEYRSWAKMKERCLNPSAIGYKDYGGRGITVCDTWLHSFASFFADMGLRPSPQHSLERRNNNQGYTPENTYWATPDIQGRNRRSNIFLSLDGQTFCATDWAFIKGMHASTLLARKRSGWSDEKALTTPVRFSVQHQRKRSQ